MSTFHQGCAVNPAAAYLKEEKIYIYTSAGNSTDWVVDTPTIKFTGPVNCKRQLCHNSSVQHLTLLIGQLSRRISTNRAVRL